MSAVLSPAPDRCAAELYDGRPCDRAAAEYAIGIPFCGRHYRKLVEDVQRQADVRRDRFEREGREAAARLGRLERAKPSFVKEATGWTFRLSLPGFDGEPRRQIRRRGFARKLDAQREAKAILDALREPLESSVQAYTAAVTQSQREAAERWARQTAETEAARLAAYESAAVARRERERDRTVYYVRRPDGAIKIGTTWNLRTRMQAFRNATPVELLASHTGGQVAEAALHRRFRHLRLDGEWFQPGQDLLAHVRHVAGCAERRARGTA